MYSIKETEACLLESKPSFNQASYFLRLIKEFVFLIKAF